MMALFVRASLACAVAPPALATPALGTIASRQHRCPPRRLATLALGAISCSTAAFTSDLGYDGNGNYTRGWYDAQCQGRANDFCRWVGLRPNEYFACQLSNNCDNDYTVCPLVRGVPHCPGYCGVS